LCAYPPRCAVIFRLIPKYFRHFLTCCSLTVPSLYTCINCRWTSLADKHFACKSQITLPTAYRNKVSNDNAIEHQLIPRISRDWPMRHLLRVSPTTNTAFYRQK
jgi:hypothetical protein